MKVSVVTAVYNRAATIGGALESVAAQRNCDVEHVIVDGMSTDGTGDIIDQSASSLTLIREPDAGIYDALNKGIEASSGDVVGFLHADDLFDGPDVLAAVAEVFTTEAVDAVYGDLVYVRADDPSKVIRYWKSGPYDRSRFRRGWMPPHPTVYMRREVYQQLGDYRIDHGSAADYECLVRLLYCGEIRVGYLPKVMVRMRVGGKSNASLANRMAANRADRAAWLANDLRPPFALRLTKPLRKLLQYVRKPPV